MVMLNAARAESLHQRALAAESNGHFNEAEALYREALTLDPTRSTTWFNLGLLYKWQSRWSESADCNQRAHELDPKDEAAGWNLGIAATALDDWDVARRAWSDLGIAVPQGTGPIMMSLGLVPLRLNPDGNAEVVWARRIDPARGIIVSIPLPESGYGCGDTVLHDGAPEGYRTLQGQEVPVFNVLGLRTASTYSTFVIRAETSGPEDMQALESLLSERGFAVEDWSESIRWLCKACSEGRPHEHHEVQPAPPGWRVQRHIGVAAVDAASLSEVLTQWAQKPGRIVISLACELDRQI